MFGLSHTDTNQSNDTIDFALYLNDNNQLMVQEMPNYYNVGSYAVGDLLKVAIEGGVVKYYQMRYGTSTWNLLYSSSRTPTYPLMLDTSLATASGTIIDAYLCTAASTSY